MERRDGGGGVIDWWLDYQRWRSAFAEMMDPRYYRIEWLDGMLWSGRAKFWNCPGAALVGELRHYPTGAYDLHFLCAAGELRDIIETLRPPAEDWGRSIGCLASLVESRDGWQRMLKAHGYSPFQTALRKELH
jgi:hypothetical protein